MTTPSSFTCRLGHNPCKSVTPEEDAIERGILHLARRCDGASSHDKVGFNGFHTELGHQLATECVGNHLGFGRRFLAHGVVLRYRKSQLEPAGIEIPEIYRPRQVAKGSPAAAGTTIPQVEVRGGEERIRGDISEVRVQKNDWMAGTLSCSEAGQRRLLKFSGVVRGGVVGSSVDAVGTIEQDDRWGPQFKMRTCAVIGRVSSGEVGVVPPAAAAVTAREQAAQVPAARRDVMQIAGVVARILWPPKENGFAGLIVDSESGTRFMAKGSIRFVTEGQSLVFSGRWMPSQRKPGEQEFHFDHAEMKAERTSAGLARWIVGLEIPGVAEGTADKIIQSLVHDRGFHPTSLWEQLAKTPELILDAKGVPKAKLEAVMNKIRQVLSDGLAENDARSQLLSWGLTPAQAQKAIEAYGPDKVIEVVKANPYQLARNKAIRGVGFVTVDTKIAPHLGITPDNPFRIQAGVEYTLEEAMAYGNIYLPASVLREKAGKVLGGSATAEALDAAVVALGAERIVVKDEDRTYLQRMYRAETCFAERLIARQRQGKKLEPLKPSEIQRFEETSNLKLSDEQWAAVSLCIVEPVCVLTGGAGRGKTTVLKAVIFVLQLRGLVPVLAAPTGRAARVMAAACSFDASTIHRLIGMRSDDEANTDAGIFEAKDILILDETSMLDQSLAESATRLLPLDKKLLLVGDPNQLPSVGAGRVLNNIIDSGVIPVARLTKVFRQALESEIIAAADMILQGFCPTPSVYEEGRFRPGQFSLVEVEAEQINETVAAIYQQARQAGIPREEIMVLSPTKGNGTIEDPGVRGLNLMMQNRFNHDGDPVLKNSNLRIGDRIIQTENDYDLSVRNGDVGYIKQVVRNDADDGKKGVWVQFDHGQLVIYPFGKLGGLELGYAVTIHKSQGSQSALVIQVMVPHFFLNRRELLYTAATRGKSHVVGVGSIKALSDGVRNATRDERFTFLMQRLVDLNNRKRAKNSEAA